MYSKDHYRALLQSALDQSYQFISFFEEPSANGKSIYLRHDVDASLKMALEMAEINHSLGIRATFFVLLRSQIYNLFSYRAREFVNRIHDLGQDIGFHCELPPNFQIDSTEIVKLVKTEYETVRTQYPFVQPIFSWHNTTPQIIEWSRKHDVPGMVNTYHPRFIDDILYRSDSLGRHTPEQFEGFLRDNPPLMQLLFHPEIWIGGGENMREVSANVWVAIIRACDYDPDGTNPALWHLVPNRIPDAILDQLKWSLIHEEDEGEVTEQPSLLNQQHALYQQVRGTMREKWNRDFPLDEMLFDRWERAQSLGFGDKASIYHNSYVYGDVRVGEHTWIGPYTLLDGSGGGIQIGNYCNVSAGVQIYTHHTVEWALTGGKATYQHAPVEIGDCTYIGPQTVISKGVKIGDHCVIGAGSLVNQDIPPYTIAFGTPCRPQGRVVVHDDNRVELIYDS
jgi:acetyltransferase-like isoleucine patch superfamily enzyme